MDAPQKEWALNLIVPLLKSHVPHVHQIKICPGTPHWDKFEDGPFQPIDDRHHTQGLFLKSWGECYPDSEIEVFDNEDLVSQEEHMALYNAIVVLFQEVPWPKQLSCAGFYQNNPTWPKTEELQTLVKNRRSVPKPDGILE